MWRGAEEPISGVWVVACKRVYVDLDHAVFFLSCQNARLADSPSHGRRWQFSNISREWLPIRDWRV